MPIQQSVFLIGYRGTGKTTVGRLLAELLECESVDSDEEIHLRAGKSIADIFADEGEEHFRDLEQSVIGELAAGSPRVVSLGGGAILREANRQALQGFPVAWLKASPEVIAERLAADEKSSSQRPNLTDAGMLKEIEQVLTERTPLYRQCATMEISAQHNSPNSVAAEIFRQLASP